MDGFRIGGLLGADVFLVMCLPRLESFCFDAFALDMRFQQRLLGVLSASSYYCTLHHANMALCTLRSF